MQGRRGGGGRGGERRGEASSAPQPPRGHGAGHKHPSHPPGDVGVRSWPVFWAGRSLPSRDTGGTCRGWNQEERRQRLRPRVSCPLPGALSNAGLPEEDGTSILQVRKRSSERLSYLPKITHRATDSKPPTGLTWCLSGTYSQDGVPLSSWHWDRDLLRPHTESNSQEWQAGADRDGAERPRDPLPRDPRLVLLIKDASFPTAPAL